MSPYCTKGDRKRRLAANDRPVSPELALFHPPSFGEPSGGEAPIAEPAPPLPCPKAPAQLNERLMGKWRRAPVEPLAGSPASTEHRPDHPPAACRSGIAHLPHDDRFCKGLQGERPTPRANINR